VNPAHTVRGPRRVITTGQTPVLDPSEARAARQHWYLEPCRAARESRADRADGLFVCPDWCRARHGSRGCLHTEPAALGAAARKVASAARCHVAIPRGNSRRLSRRRRAAQRSQAATISHDRPRHWQTDAHRATQANAYAGSVGARPRRDQHQAWQSQFPGDRITAYSRTVGRSKRPPPWRTAHRPARRSFMTGGATSSRSMTSSAPAGRASRPSACRRCGRIRGRRPSAAVRYRTRFL
jgi:HAMP domain-containing protein